MRLVIIASFSPHYRKTDEQRRKLTSISERLLHPPLMASRVSKDLFINSPLTCLLNYTLYCSNVLSLYLFVM